MAGILRVPRTAALVTIALLIAAASLTSFAESYRGLFDWAREHGLSGGWAAVWPLQCDTFIAVGELALFIALADRWTVRSRIGAWAVTLTGLAVSVAGNVGHVHSRLLTDRATAAVPPLAAAAALAVGLGVLKRVVEAHHRSAPESAPESALAPALTTAPGEHNAARIAEEFIPRVETIHVPPGAPGLNGRAHPKRTRTRERTRPTLVSGTDAESEFMTDLAAGALPSLRQIRARMHVGQDRAKTIREHLKSVLIRT